MNYSSLRICFFVTCGAFAAAMAGLFQLRLASGDVFPAYSTFRADPLGTRALFESLSELQDLQVERSLRALEKISPTPPRTIVLAGMRKSYWEELTTKTSNPLDAAVREGSRLIVVFAAIDEEAERDEKRRVALKKEDSGKPSPKNEARPRSREKETPEKPEPRRSEEEDDTTENTRHKTDWSRLWGFELALRPFSAEDEGALFVAGFPAKLPASVPWRSSLYFRPLPGSDWQTVYNGAGLPVMMEAKIGRGSVVLASDSYFLSNEALHTNRRTSLLSWALGSSRQVVFYESHLGIEEERGIASLARHYGLSSTFFVLLLLAGLYIWKRGAYFLPPTSEEHEVSLTFHQASGLEALLKRAVTHDQLMKICLAEWKKAARTSDAARVEKEILSSPPKSAPSELYNAAVLALKKR